jgi:hypothetical protein
MHEHETTDVRLVKVGTRSRRHTQQWLVTQHHSVYRTSNGQQLYRTLPRTIVPDMGRTAVVADTDGTSLPDMNRTTAVPDMDRTLVLDKVVPDTDRTTVVPNTDRTIVPDACTGQSCTRHGPHNSCTQHRPDNCTGHGPDACTGQSCTQHRPDNCTGHGPDACTGHGSDNSCTGQHLILGTHCLERTPVRTIRTLQDADVCVWMLCNHKVCVNMSVHLAQE